MKYTKRLSQIMKRSSFIFEENQVSIEEDNLSKKVVTIEEELDRVDVDGIGNLVGFPRLMLSIKYVEILK